MSKSKNSKPSGGRESFLIFLVAGCGILATLSFNQLTEPVSPPDKTLVMLKVEQAKNNVSPKSDKSLALIDVPLATGHESLDKLFIQSGCGVCHTIPGISSAKGREGPKLA